ncbi:hypothetical protein G7B40_025155 [Aetokthonos hydrillicola Thurmond2011]|jgi:hypothetical protein|uniref:Uncharacterized protein n=1 Tax=Aetokthonos hydrillicola Thurmond2011 TaxID=2712845 RepID=A0AAP5IAF1_9CYAN|nr:hypothetical protein [Aetokthonos hydrillicola]MBO3458454.1 hypothetical protein [Aetokthonos hydrillicola CCALA 1050]MBW4586219.1 hypothetical protein [Aetokthonos hydrillicola CCALA 1050]MDR9897826.1 hypothetical protein [Aetokthonos hydrillicola Thurmond2011]
MSYTKRYLEANALWNETLGKWIFTDGYGENPPPDILQLRLNKAEINHPNPTSGITITEVTEVQKIE